MISKNKAEGRVLLPCTIIPIRYDIKITPNLETFTFEGNETIQLQTFECGADCNEIKMHAKELCFSSASFYSIDTPTESNEAEEIRINLKATTVTFIFTKAIPTNAKLNLIINYSGFLNNQMAGFYRSTYTDINGVKKIMASTQFEALDARRAFPCWDEPARKAVFGLTLVIPSNLTAFSNMPEQALKRLEGGKLTEIKFLDSPKMSTYLLAFVVGEFDYVQELTKHGVMIRVYTPPGKAKSGEFALDCAVKCLDLYDDFFGVPYPLPKLDMVAIPEFAMGAMENWGCVTYREVDLLISETASSSQKQRVGVVVCHELAHQWFGNLVTMAWWDDLWLNEGFASWTENYALSNIFTEWNMWDQFVTDAFSSALRLDALRSSHPIQVPIAHAEEVEEVFDGISYCKGASVNRMIRAVLGLKAYQRGLVAYMKKHQYGNTETFDLWQAWETSSGMPIQEMMASWTEQMGFPLLKILNETWEDTKVTLEVEQEWFLSSAKEVLTEEDLKKVWCIPILTCTSEGTQQDLTLMREKQATITIPISSTSSWVKLNAGQEVPMRILPSDTMLSKLAPAIQDNSLPTADRVGMLLDAYALVKAGKMSPKSLIKLVSNYQNETDPVVWQGIEDVLSGLYSILSSDENLESKFNTFASSLIMKLTKIVQWEPSKEKPDDHLTSLLRGIFMRLLKIFCYNDEEVQTEAKKRFHLFIHENDASALPTDIRTSVFSIVLKKGTIKEFNDIKAYFESASDNADKKHALSSIGNIADEKLKLSVMDWATSGQIKIQDFFYPMGSVNRSNAKGKEITVEYLKENFDRIHNMVKKASPSLMDAVIGSCCGGFSNKGKIDDIEAFLKSKNLPQNARTINQILENMRANSAFLDTLKDSLNDDDFWNNL